MGIQRFKDLPLNAKFQFVRPKGMPLTAFAAQEFQRTGQIRYTDAFGQNYRVGTGNGLVEMIQLPAEFAGASVSRGTLVIEDVYSSVEDIIDHKLVREFRDTWAAAMRDAWECHQVHPKDLSSINYDDFSTEYKEKLSDILNSNIWEYLNQVAPDGCYFGAHPGDGSNFGFWPKEDD